MQILFSSAILFLLLLNPAVAGIGDTYVCDEKKFTKKEERGRLILDWRQAEFSIRDEKNEKLVDVSGTHQLTISTPNYFLTIEKYRDGHTAHSFDGKTYSTLYVENAYSFHNEYVCKKF